MLSIVVKVVTESSKMNKCSIVEVRTYKPIAYQQTTEHQLWQTEIYCECGPYRPSVVKWNHPFNMIFPKNNTLSAGNINNIWTDFIIAFPTKVVEVVVDGEIKHMKIGVRSDTTALHTGNSLHRINILWHLPAATLHKCVTDVLEYSMKKSGYATDEDMYMCFHVCT